MYTRSSNVFGEIVNEEMHLSQMGQIVHDFWHQVSSHFINVEVAPFIVMPNHVHAIIIIHDRGHGRGVVPTPEDGKGGISTRWDEENAPGGRETLPLPNLGQIVAYYKYQTTKQINEQNSNPGTRIWQRNYYERIVRNDNELRRFSEYIQTNPQQWQSDLLNPSALPNPYNRETYKSV